jgi:hypothetical protein
MIRVKKPIALFAMLLPCYVLAAQFDVVLGDGEQVCSTYKSNLESFDENKIAPLICERPLNSALPELSRPALRNLHISDHRSLYRDVLSYLNTAPDEMLLSNASRFKDRLKEFSEPIDIANNGVRRRVVIFRDGRCRIPDGTSRAYQTAILVIRDEGDAVDRAVTARLNKMLSRRHSTMQLFTYQGNVYVDFWASAEVYSDRDILYVYKMSGNDVRKVCELKYNEEGAWK